MLRWARTSAIADVTARAFAGLDRRGRRAEPLRRAAKAPFGEPGAAGVAVVDEDRRLLRVVLAGRGDAADVPPVADGEQRQDADRGVLGGVQRPPVPHAVLPVEQVGEIIVVEGCGAPACNLDEGAERFARQALSTYSKRNPRLVLLAHDIAYFWMEAGHFGQALALFESVAPLVTDPVEQLWVHANLMRAAAGARQSDRADQAAQLVRRWCLDPALQAGLARAQLELARGELQLRRWEAAQTAAEQALRAARDRREGRTTLSAEALLEAITAARAAGRPAPTQAVPPADPPDHTLTEALLASLRDLPEGLTAAESAPETAAGVSVPRGSSSP